MEIDGATTFYLTSALVAHAYQKRGLFRRVMSWSVVRGTEERGMPRYFGMKTNNPAVYRILRDCTIVVPALGLYPQLRGADQAEAIYALLTDRAHSHAA